MCVCVDPLNLNALGTDTFWKANASTASWIASQSQVSKNRKVSPFHKRLFKYINPANDYIIEERSSNQPFWRCMCRDGYLGDQWHTDASKDPWQAKTGAPPPRSGSKGPRWSCTCGETTNFAERTNCRSCGSPWWETMIQPKGRRG